jgi:hypothetical protein
LKGLFLITELLHWYTLKLHVMIGVGYFTKDVDGKVRQAA